MGFSTNLVMVFLALPLLFIVGGLLFATFLLVYSWWLRLKRRFGAVSRALHCDAPAAGALSTEPDNVVAS